jgi:hypothetical protein
MERERHAGNGRGLITAAVQACNGPYGIRPFCVDEASAFRRRASSAASANSQVRNVVIFGRSAVAFGQTIHYAFDIFREISIGLTRRPLIRSDAASAVRASAMPWPSTAASISMLARFRAGP